MPKLTPSQRAFVRARSKVTDEERLDGELNIVPFLDIVINLIMFLLMATASITSYAQVATEMPGQSPAPSTTRTAERLRLGVMLTSSGIHVVTSRAQLAGDCVSEGVLGAPTIPTHFGAYDWDALRICAARVRDSAEAAGVEFRDAQGQGLVTLNADPLVEYQDVMRAMDALREDQGRALFPVVLLSVGVR